MCGSELPADMSEEPENIVRIAQQKLLTGKRSPVPGVVFSLLPKKPLKSFGQTNKAMPTVWQIRLLMKAGIIVIHAVHT